MLKDKLFWKAVGIVLGSILGLIGFFWLLTFKPGTFGIAVLIGLALVVLWLLILSVYEVLRENKKTREREFSDYGRE